MIPPVRILTIGTSSREITEALGFGSAVVAELDAHTLASDGASGCPFAPFVPGHPTVHELAAWVDYIESVGPDTIVAEGVCNYCLRGASHAWWPGTPQTIAIGRPPLAECLDLLIAVGSILGVEGRATSVYTRRSARLLALRMHVARYLVRSEGKLQPRTIALVREGHAWRVSDDVRVAELIEAVGGVSSSLPRGGLISENEVAAARVDVILAGGEASPTDDPVIAVAVEALSGFAPAVWHADWSALVRSSGPSIVDAVEATLRATFPETLGANGTPPPSTVFRRVAPPASPDC